MRYIIEPQSDGKMLRDYLRAIGISASLLARLKRREDGIVLNGRRVTVRAVLSAGDCLDLAVEDSAAPEKILPTDLPLEILLQTPDFLVVNKPPMMPTHPSHGHFTDTLANALAFHFSTQSEPFVPRFINRLDRDTTGVVLVARHALAAATLSSLMAERKITKRYLALVRGRLDTPTVIETGIRRRTESIIFREVCPVGEGDFAKTEVIPLACNDALSLVRLIPHTGRTHQLRVHLASVGHPLLGDGLYGETSDLIDRHALHAAGLSFSYPDGGEQYHIGAPLPADWGKALALLGREAMLFAEQECR